MKFEKVLLVIAFLAVAASLAQAQNGTNTPTPDDGDGTANPTTTTTAGATTSQTPTTTTAPTPTLPPEPKAGKWHVNATKDTVCMIVQLGARFTFSYSDKNNGTQNVTEDLPFNSSITTATGHCGNDTQDITLSYNQNCKMTMNFVKKDSKFSVNKINLSFATDCFQDPPKATIEGQLVNVTLFQASVGQSYLCNAQQKWQNLSKNIVALEVVDVQVEAFAKDKKDFNFATAQECPQDAETSNIVPIAVGAALAALVLIVLIAYLISRNRGQRGYESV